MHQAVTVTHPVNQSTNNRTRRSIMGDKGGKKDKEKSKKQTTQKSKQSDKKKADKQPAKKA